MNITLNIVAGSAAELQEAIDGLASQPVVTNVSVKPVFEVVKPKRDTKPVEEKPPAEEPKVEPSEQAPEEIPELVTEEAPIPTIVELRAKASDKGATPEGKKAIKALLDKFESKSVSSVPEKLRAAFLQGLEEI